MAQDCPEELRNEHEYPIRNIDPYIEYDFKIKKCILKHTHRNGENEYCMLCDVDTMK